MFLRPELYRRLAEIVEGTEQEWIDGRRATFVGTRDRWYRVACSLYLVRARAEDSRSGLDWQHLDR